MPKEGYMILTLPIGIREDLRRVGEQMGFYGHKNVTRTLRHLIKLAEDRPDFYHVLNKQRKYPPIDKRYASL